MRRSLLLLLMVAAAPLATGRVLSAWAGSAEKEAEMEADSEFPDAATREEAAAVAAAERRLSVQIRALLQHYRQPDPVGLPGVPVPDPLPVPETRRSLPMATVTVSDAQVFGLSRFRVDSLELDLANLTASLQLRLERLEMTGAYKASYFFTTSSGRLNVTLEEVTVSAAATLAVDRDGALRTDAVHLDVHFQAMRVNILNDRLSPWVRSALEAMAPFLYDTIKPFILREAQQTARADLDREASKLPQRFPNSVAPLDLLVWDARRLVTHMGLDPYPLPDYAFEGALISLRLSHIWLSGLATFHRAGDARLGFRNHVFHMTVRAGAGELAGQCHWHARTLRGYVTRAGDARFSIDHVEALVELSQPLDTRQRPRLERLEIHLGQFAVRVAGAGSLDYAAELLANALPNLLRSHIRATIERHAKAAIERELARIDVQELVEGKLAELEEMEAAAEEMEKGADLLDSL